MPRSKENFGDTLEKVMEQFTTELISAVDAARFLGLDARTVRTHLPVKKVGRAYYISRTNLARWLC